MAFELKSGSFVRKILYNRHGHWLIIIIGAEGEDEVFVYDGLYQSVSKCVHK